MVGTACVRHAGWLRPKHWSNAASLVLFDQRVGRSWVTRSHRFAWVSVNNLENYLHVHDTYSLRHGDMFTARAGARGIRARASKVIFEQVI